MLGILAVQHSKTLLKMSFFLKSCRNRQISLPIGSIASLSPPFYPTFPFPVHVCCQWLFELVCPRPDRTGKKRRERGRWKVKEPLVVCLSLDGRKSNPATSLAGAKTVHHRPKQISLLVLPCLRQGQREERRQVPPYSPCCQCQTLSLSASLPSRKKNMISFFVV